jgi:hypothetical protein
MKKIMLTLVGLLALGYVNAQSKNDGQTSKGKWLIEANTGSWATGNTSFSLMTTDGNTSWSVGLDGGYFISDDLAIKAGFGYSDSGASDIFTYKVGAKYYVGSQFPIGADFTGISNDNFDATWIGLQGGYAWFVGKNVSIEPAIRYNITLDEAKADSAFQALVGFALHF